MVDVDVLSTHEREFKRMTPLGTYPGPDYLTPPLGSRRTGLSCLLPGFRISYSIRDLGPEDWGLDHGEVVGIH